MDTPTDRTPVEPTIPVVVHEQKAPEKCSECEDALIGFHYHGGSATFNFHLSWWTLWIALMVAGGIYAAITGNKSFFG